MTITLVEGANANGKITGYSFPSKVTVGVEAAYSIDVSNIGGAGDYGCGLVNETGNPGYITILTETGISFNLDQGDYLRTHKVGPAGDMFTTNKKVIFSVVGTYNIPLWNMYLDPDGVWRYTVEAELSVEVVEEEVEQTFWEKLKEFVKENPLAFAVGVGSVVLTGAVVGGKAVGRRKEH